MGQCDSLADRAVWASGIAQWVEHYGLYSGIAQRLGQYGIVQ